MGWVWVAVCKEHRHLNPYIWHFLVWACAALWVWVCLCVCEWVCGIWQTDTPGPPTTDSAFCLPETIVVPPAPFPSALHATSLSRPSPSGP